MKLRTIRVLFRKEILDLLRDRRTLVSLVIAPMLIGPLMMSGTTYYMRRNADEARVQRFRVALAERVPLPELKPALAQAGLELANSADPRAAVENKEAAFGIEVDGAPQRPSVTFYSDNADMKSSMGRRRVESVLDLLSQQRVSSELQRRGVPPEVLQPFDRKAVNTAKPQQMSGAFAGRLVSFFLLIFLFNGAMYAAVDATAGEKERKTLEVLLASSAGRGEIVTAKMMAAMCTSFGTTALSIGSYALAFASMAGPGGGGGSGPGLTVPSDPLSLLLLAFLILPMALMAASVAIAGATPARSTREAMSYLTPGIFVVMGLGMVPMLTTDTSTWLTLLPFANFAQTLREVLSGDRNWLHYGITLMANTVYSAIAIGLAVHAFTSEKILFRS
ncbi:MAG TPA: ABC transporter permease [Bryobacteraceae bacterium]|nr:ABC transporter permease [Bryobacteraceae bacterium]